MVSPLRNNSLKCTADSSFDGMYIVGRPNINMLDIPSLPTIVNSDQGLVVNSLDGGQLIGLECNELFDNFSEGDIVWVNSRLNQVKSVLSSRSTANTLLLTEQCENRCLFCSQPPNQLSDTHLYHQAALALLNFNSQAFIGLSGGEPTHNENAFITLLSTLKQFDNCTKLHILSNGRRFRDNDFTNQIVEIINGRDVLWGIPLYGHYSDLHNHLVVSENAFIDTVEGLLNLSSQGQSIELRILPVKDNLKYLENIIQFVVSSFLNLPIISIMNLEPKGYARKNFNSLYASVEDQVPSLERAVECADRFGVEIRLFNYPLCLLSEVLRCKAVKSISDWKNYYTNECLECKLRNDCGGFFTSSKGKFLENIRKIL